jgi:hypothetical protein
MEQAEQEGTVPFQVNHFVSEIANKSSEQESIECFADNVKFTCVWQRPEVNMHIINQIMNQINVYHDNDYDDCTPSNITALISASFSSAEILNELSDGISIAVAAVNDDDNDDDGYKHGEVSDITASFVASTPISTIKTSGEMIALNDDKNGRQMLSLAFRDTSPILIASRQRIMYTKRRLHLS